MMKKVTDLSFWEGILCDTEDEAIAICKLMKEANIVRRSNKKVSEEDTHRDDTRWNWITYFPKEWVYWNDKYDWKTSKYKIYPAVLFYLREEVIEKDWIDDYFNEFGWLLFKEVSWFRQALEKHAPKPKKFSEREIKLFARENAALCLPISWYNIENAKLVVWNAMVLFAKTYNLLSEDTQWETSE